MTTQESLRQALTFQNAGRLAEAEKIYRQVLSTEPNNADALHLLGLVAHHSRHGEAAVELIRRAIAFKPNIPGFHSNLGSVLLALGRYDQAIEANRQALRLDPRLAKAHSGLGSALLAQNKIDEAIVELGRAVELAPESTGYAINLANAWKEAGRIDQALTVLRGAQKLVNADPGVHSALLYLLQFAADFDDAAIWKEMVAWRERWARPLRHFSRNYTNERSPDRKLKIGYVSADFCNHPQAHMIIPVLDSHDRDRFEIHAYANVRNSDNISDVIRQRSDAWHDVAALADSDLDDMVRGHGIDILVDLTMHGPRNRLLTFARQPAPIQATWLAYPGTTGLDTIDFRLTDTYMDPPDEPTPYYSESSVRLPDFWVCYHSLGNVPFREHREAGPIRFGSLNSPWKLNAGTLRLWARLLAETGDSRLKIHVIAESHRQSIRDLFTSERVDPSRIDFVARQPRAQYLEEYHTIDILLDTLPYNGIVSTCDALWMGVPMVTLAGNRAAGRAGTALLTTLNLPELAARTPDQFIRIATQLAGDLPRLADLRRSLRRMLLDSPICDARRFTGDIETAYRDMWQRWCSGDWTR